MVAVSNAEALSILQHANENANRTAQQGEIAGELAVMGAKKQALDATISQTKAETKDSLVKFGSAGIGSILNAKATLYGQGHIKPIRQMKDEADAAFATRTQRDAAQRAAALSASNNNGLGNFVNSATDAVSQSAGPQADVKQAQIASKLADISETAGKQLLEHSKQSKDGAQKAIESTLDFARGMYERASATVGKIFS